MYLAQAYKTRRLSKLRPWRDNLNRWHDSKAGRWISKDPIGFAAGDANLYRYAGNSPTNFLDPNGLVKVNTGRFWDGAVTVASAQGLPKFLMWWGRHNSISVDLDISVEGWGWTGWMIRTNDTVTVRRLLRLGAVGLEGYKPKSDRTAMGSLYQETFHAWFALRYRNFDETWLGQLISSQTQFPNGRRWHMVEEAMSEIVQSYIDNYPKKPPYQQLVDELGNGGVLLTPCHNEPGQKWANDPAPRRAIDEAMYYATLWIIHNGERDPCPGCTPAQRLEALKKAYESF